MTAGPRLVLLGRQGSGKGTQAEMLAERFGINHLSTGTMLRDSAHAGIAAGLEAKALMDQGELVADEKVIAVVEERFSNPAEISRGFVLDGFPRTRVQATALQRILESAPLDLVIDLEVPEDIVVTRLLERGRADDTEDAIRRRLDLYESETAPLIELYGTLDIIERVNGIGDPDAIHKQLIDLVEGRVERLHASV